MAKPGYSKQKGNKYEIKIARKLSKWMFNDADVLWRDSTSGGRKQIYNGDIVPAKAHSFPWKVWPFLFELKNGYKAHIPTLMNQTKLREWLVKLVQERTEEQYIPVLIAQFHFQIPIMVTPMLLNFACDTCLIQAVDGFYYQFYVYHFNEVTKEPFHHILPQDVKDKLAGNMKNVVEMQAPKGTDKEDRKVKNKVSQQEEIGDIIGQIMI